MDQVFPVENRTSGQGLQAFASCVVKVNSNVVFKHFENLKNIIFEYFERKIGYVLPPGLLLS